MLSCLSAPPHRVHHATCGCVSEAPAQLGRRGILAGLAALTGAALLPAGARAASGNYEAMLVNCIDPRFTSGSLAYMGANAMRDKYSQFVIAGGPLAVAHDRFAPWHQAFWDNLDITIALHNIKKVVALSHRDCGAAKLAFGDAAVGTRAAETATHATALQRFRAAVTQRKPALGVITGIMDLDGSVDIVS
jgi:hypothetical protein